MHTSSTLVLVIAVFAASLVEMVEALTIVVAAGVSRGWRSALEGAAAAVLVLGVLVVVVGVPLIRYIPIDALRVIVGALLLVLGLSWLRKAILRASGHKDPHDEDKIYAETVAELTSAGSEQSEEKEAAAQSPAAGTGAGAGAAAAQGTRRRRLRGGLQGCFPRGHRGGADRDQPRRRAAPARPGRPRRSRGGGPGGHRRPHRGAPAERGPRNTIKTLVGVMLTSFGVFWVGEGAGVHWPGDDLAIPVLVGFFVVVYFGFTAFMRTRLPGRVIERAAQ